MTRRQKWLMHDDETSRPARIVFTLRALASTGWAVFLLQPFGHRQWAFTTIAGILASVVLGPWLTARSRARPPGARHVGSSLLSRRRLLIGGLACWLGLIVWSSLSAGGIMPRSKSDSGAIRVLTWNILHGRDHGAPWTRWAWSTRKKALRSALAATQPEIFCVQEALSEQVDSMGVFLHNHNHVGVGRDDGRSAGEFCAIFYDSRRFAELDTGTFWLDEPTDEPPSSLTLGPKRIGKYVSLGPFWRHGRLGLCLNLVSPPRVARSFVRKARSIVLG